jgi:hypothetical protein
MLAIIDDGEQRLVLCPDHQLSYAMAQIGKDDISGFASRLEEHECEICCSPACVYADEVELYLCRRHLGKLIRKDLSPMEYTILYENHREFRLIYEDLYSKGGYALQPIR